MSKLVVIVGATGKQGSSVIQSILADPKASGQFKLRGITRDPSSAKGQQLASQGVEPVKADLDDVESLKKAFEGAYAVFGMTDFWQIFDKARETQQGKNIGDAAKAAGVKHLVFSSLYEVEKTTNGKLKNVYHFDSKAEAADYIATLGVPYTFFLAGCYMSNFPPSTMPDQNGELTWYTPIPIETKFPLFAAAEDTGKFVKAILLKPEQTIGKYIHGATADVSFEEMYATVAKVTGKPAKALQVPREVYIQTLVQNKMPEAVAIELTEMWEFMQSPGYFKGEKIDTDILDEPPTTWEEFVKKTEKWGP